MEDNNDEKKSNRRDFLYISTAAVGAVTVGAAVWPLVNQMNPSADVAALSSIEVDINDLEPGSQLTVKWLGKPGKGRSLNIVVSCVMVLSEAIRQIRDL